MKLLYSSGLETTSAEVGYTIGKSERRLIRRSKKYNKKIIINLL